MRAADHARVWERAVTLLDEDIGVLMNAEDDIPWEMADGLIGFRAFARTIAQAYREEAERNPE